MGRESNARYACTCLLTHDERGFARADAADGVVRLCFVDTRGDHSGQRLHGSGPHDVGVRADAIGGEIHVEHALTTLLALGGRGTGRSTAWRSCCGAGASDRCELRDGRSILPDVYEFVACHDDMIRRHGEEDRFDVDVLAVDGRSDGVAQNQDELAGSIVRLGSKHAVLATRTNRNQGLDVLDVTLICVGVPEAHAGR